MCTMTSSAKKKKVLPLSQPSRSIISFSCLIAVARSPRATLNMRHESGLSQLALDLSRNVFSVIKCNVWCRFLAGVFCEVEEVPFYL